MATSATRAPPVMPPRFEIPPRLRFTCARCGDCCRSWNVMLGPGERERVEAFDWRGRVEELVGARTVVRTPSGPRGEAVDRLARHDDGACAFLGEDRLCLIHRHFGEAAKPLMCRLYPFGFYPIDGKVAIDVSFACHAVSLDQGAPAGERVAEWTVLLGDSEARERKHWLDRRRALSGAVLWELEHHLLTFLRNPDLSLPQRVRCCLAFLRLATTGDPATPAARRLRYAIATGLPRQVGEHPPSSGMDRTQGAVFQQWLFLTLNPTPVNFDLLSRSDQEAERRRRMEAGRRFQEKQGSPLVDNRELSPTFATIDEVDTSIFLDRPVPSLERYLAAKVVGQRFLLDRDGELPLTDAIPALLLAVPMTIWTARALAAARAGTRVEEDDVRRALRLIDRTLGQIPIAALPRKVADAWRWVVVESELAIAATEELLGTATERLESEDEVRQELLDGLSPEIDH